MRFYPALIRIWVYLFPRLLLQAFKWAQKLRKNSGHNCFDYLSNSTKKNYRYNGLYLMMAEFGSYHFIMQAWWLKIYNTHREFFLFSFLRHGVILKKGKGPITKLEICPHIPQLFEKRRMEAR